MYEFESIFDKGLTVGLRREAVSPVKDQQLVVCRNLRPGEFGLRPVESITYPFDELFIWPFPQMFLLSQLRLMATETAIYECDSSWNTTMALEDLTIGGSWQVADYGKYVVMTNGQQMVVRNSAGVWSSFASTVSMPGMKTICAFHGRLIGGNINTGWEDCGAGHVVWSDIGSISCYPDIKNEAGFAPMTWSGEVLRVLPLSNMVVIYGENGITFMKPSAQHMGFADLDLTGIPNAMAVAGSDRGHLLVDSSGVLWFIGPDGKPKKLGYQEFMIRLSLDDLIVSYNRQENEYYISDGVLSFIFGEAGLCETHQLVSSVVYDGRTLYGTWESDNDISAQIVTDVMDFGQRAFKTLEILAVDCSSKSDMWTQLHWRSDNKGDFQESDQQWVNPSGFTTPMITAIDFKLAFEAEDYSDVRIAYIKSRLKLSDKRMIRGIYNAS